MKFVCLLFVLLLPTFVFAQKQTSPRTKTQLDSQARETQPLIASQTTYSLRNRYFDLHLGSHQNATNFGGNIGKRLDEYLGFGGYLHIQTKRDGNNNAQVVQESNSIGAQVRTYLKTTPRFEAYMGPGFGLIIFRDIMDSNGKKNDVTAFGPSLSLGVQYPLNEKFKIGLDRFEAWNLFDDKAPSAVIAYRFSGTFLF